MDNNELMRILLLLNKSKKNKDLAVFLGAVAVVTAGVAVYCYYKNKESKDELASMQRRNKTLFAENQQMLKMLQRQNPTNSQSLTKIKLPTKNTPPETGENKG